MKNKYVIGQKIKIKKDLDKIKNFEHEYNPAMKFYEDSIQTIDGVYDTYFTIENCSFDWDYRAIEAFKFKKDDIQFGDIITTRNGERYIYADEHLFGESSSYYLDCWDCSDSFKNDLKSDDCDKDYDIIKIERNKEVIYERNDEIREMTLQQIIDELGYEVKIVKEEE